MASDELIRAIKKNQKNTGAPDVHGFRKVWADEFRGPAGSTVDANDWDIIEKYPNYNNEVQAYTRSAENHHLSGDGELLIIPKKHPEWLPGTRTHWSSARLEGKHSFRCEPGEKMLFQAEIKVGQHPTGEQMGIWPAFWALGQSLREGAGWPVCGEWDILEMVNGWHQNSGAIHFSYDGVHNAGADWKKFSRKVPMNRDRFHTFTLRVNRKPNPFQEETLTWLVDDKEFFQIKGADVGTEAQWTQLAHSPFFPLLNVAIGGNFPNDDAGFGTPTDATRDGLGSGLTVRYVAVYKSTN